MSPCISVIVPLYESAATIRRCLQSVLDQTYEDIEVIVVNDGSTDEGPQIVRTIAAQDPRIRMIDQSNQGLGAARNTGIRHARGTFISCVDSDDVMLPLMLERMLAAIESADAQMAICQARETVYSKGVRARDAGSQIIPGEAQVVTGLEALRMQLSCEVPILFNSVCFKLIPRSTFIDHDIWFPEGFRYAEDTPTSTNLFIHTQTVALVREDLYEYIHEGDTLTSAHSMKKAWDICLNTEEIRAQLDSHHLDVPFDNFALSMIFPVEKNLFFASGEDDDLRMRVQKIVSRWRSEYRPLSLPGVPLIQRLKIRIGYQGWTKGFLGVARHLAWVPSVARIL